MVGAPGSSWQVRPAGSVGFPGQGGGQETATLSISPAVSLINSFKNILVEHLGTQAWFCRRLQTVQGRVQRPLDSISHTCLEASL